MTIDAEAQPEPRPHPIIKTSQGALGLIFGFVQGIAQTTIRMFPDWAVVNTILLLLSGGGIVCVAIWWAWTVAGHSALTSVRSRQWAFSVAVGALSLTLIVAITLFVNGAMLASFFVRNNSDGTMTVNVPKGAWATRAEWRVHLDGTGGATPIYLDNVLRGFALTTNIEITHPTEPGGSAAAKPDEFPQINIFVIFIHPIRLKDAKQVRVTYSAPNAPEFGVRDAGPYWVYITAFGHIAPGDLDVFVHGDAE